MARIRSIHPGIWTDDAFAGLSDAASLLLLGLWNESDDNGVFEWKPITLKMRLRPAKDETIAQINAMLQELVDAGLIKAFVDEGRTFGAVRNFARYQRPKLPNSIHPLPEVLFAYVGLTSEGARPRSGMGRPPAGSTSPAKAPSAGRTSEVIPKDFGSGSEVGRQREEEGGRRKDGKGEKEGEKEVVGEKGTGSGTGADVVAPWDEPGAKPSGDAIVLQRGLVKITQAYHDQLSAAFTNLTLARDLPPAVKFTHERHEANRRAGRDELWEDILWARLGKADREEEARRAQRAVSAAAAAKQAAAGPRPGQAAI